MIEETLDIATRDGAMETFLCRPERGGPFPPVLLLMDAPGIREELRDMARRLGTVGHLVLLPNLYYRAGRDTTYGPEVLTEGSAEHQRMRAVRTKMTIPPVMEDVAAMRLPRPSRRGEGGAGGLPRLLHERPLRARRRGPIPRSHRCRRLVLWHLAGQRRRGEPASLPSARSEASFISPAPSTTSLAPLPMVEELRRRFETRALRARSSFIPASITASPSRSAGATTSRRRNGIGSG